MRQFFKAVVDNPLVEARLHELHRGDSVFFHDVHILAVHGSHWVNPLIADKYAWMVRADLSLSLRPPGVSRWCRFLDPRPLWPRGSGLCPTYSSPNSSKILAACRREVQARALRTSPQFLPRSPALAAGEQVSFKVVVHDRRVDSV